jgi:hypothetical protein
VLSPVIPQMNVHDVAIDVNVSAPGTWTGVVYVPVNTLSPKLSCKKPQQNARPTLLRPHAWKYDAATCVSAVGFVTAFGARPGHDISQFQQ